MTLLQGFLLAVTALQSAGDAPVGTWTGTLNAGGQKLQLVLDISREADGGLRGTFDVPAQGAKGLLLDSCTFKDSTLRFAFKAAGFRFEGKRDGRQIKGTFHQAGLSFPLTLKLGGTVVVPKRPQAPKPPYDYGVEEVVYPSAPGVKIAGTFTVPRGRLHPAVVLVTGSGAQDRDETLLNHKPFHVLAHHLTNRGIAVLRCDDRGVGKSTGDFAKATTEDFAVDAAAGVEWLRKHPAIDPDRIGIIGHSEGGVVAPMVAARDPRVAFVVLLAGTGVTGEAILYRQAALIARTAGTLEIAVAANRKLQEKIFKVIREEPDDAVAAARIRKMLKGMMPKAQVDGQIAMTCSPWFRFFLDHDPRPVLRKVKCPVLAINGERDLQVDPRQNIPEIMKALRDGGNKDVKGVELPGLNHLFQTCKTGLMGEYGVIEETFSPDALGVVSDWILARMGKKP